ncbi:MAG TPA: SRPBCC domain-containing protein [Gemmatimonadales bacterium]|nr:SRPBCC domain-containing protein [Gemmatimonadales bacterium]
MTAKADTQSILQTYELPSPPAKVWRALTEPELLERWLMSNDLKPAVGQSFTFRMEPTKWWDGIVHCEVLEFEPQKRLSYTWRSGPESSPLDTVVTWTLTPTPSGGTRLELEHSGFVPKNKFAFEGARQGWEHMVNQRLSEVLRTL